LLHRRFYDSSRLSSRGADTNSSPAVRRVPEVQGTPGTDGLSGLAEPGVGSRKQVPLCNLLRCLSRSLRARPSTRTHVHGSLVLFSLLSDWGCTIIYLFIKGVCECKVETLEALSSVFPARSIPRRTGEVQLRETRKPQSQPALP